MFEILENTIEWQKWGWNIATITFLFTIPFTMLDGWGYKKQGETIWKKGSAESISAITFVYSASLCYSYTIYSLYIGSLAILFNGIILGYNIIPIVWGLFKFKKFTRIEKTCMAVFPLMIPAMIFLPWKKTMFFLFMMCALVSLPMQPVEMLKEKSAGAVDIRTMTVFTFGVFFWALYGFAIRDFGIAIPNSIACAIFLSVIFLWFKYQKEPLTFSRLWILFIERKQKEAVYAE